MLSGEKRYYRLGINSDVLTSKMQRKRVSFSGGEAFYEVSYLKEILVVNLAVAASFDHRQDDMRTM